MIETDSQRGAMDEVTRRMTSRTRSHFHRQTGSLWSQAITLANSRLASDGGRGCPLINLASVTIETGAAAISPGDQMIASAHKALHAVSLLTVVGPDADFSPNEFSFPSEIGCSLYHLLWYCGEK